MNILLITYDIHDDEDRADCLETIKGMKYFEVGESDYLVKTSKDSEDVRDLLTKYISKGDRLFVCIKGLGAWKGLEGLKKWLEE
jgi:hypothetical protein